MIISNRTALAKVAPGYLPIIEVAVETYRRVFADALLSVRLLGSVARGEAIVGVSDIDFAALVDSTISASSLRLLEEAERRLAEEHPIVAGVDLEAVPIDGLSDVRRFILRTDSLVVFGGDALEDGEVRISRDRLIELVTPSAADLIAAYRPAIQQGDGPALPRYSRIVGKDLLKVLRGVALMHGAAYDNNLEHVWQSVLEHAPEQSALANELYTLYREPTTSNEHLLTVLAAAERSIIHHS